MNKRFENLILAGFGERLGYLMQHDTEEHGGSIDPENRGASKELTKRLYKFKILEYNDSSENSKSQQINITGRTVLKHLSSESTPETIWIKRYCEYFKCSADYLFGYIPLPTHENTDIESYTGLSNDSIECLHMIYTVPQDDTSHPNQKGRYDIIALNIILEDCYRKLKGMEVKDHDLNKFSDVTASILHHIGVYLDANSMKVNGSDYFIAEINQISSIFTSGETIRSIVQERILNCLKSLSNDESTYFKVHGYMQENQKRFEDSYDKIKKEFYSE